MFFGEGIFSHAPPENKRTVATWFVNDLRSLPLFFELLELPAREVGADVGLHPGEDHVELVVPELLKIPEHAGAEKHLPSRHTAPPVTAGTDRPASHNGNCG